MRKYCVTMGKPEEGSVNEDAVKATDKLIAVSDGAGGGGLFAERWSGYMLERLPDTPLHSAEELDDWIDTIWEPYYNQCEEDAGKLGGISLDKFYDEGSFATLVVVWKMSDDECQWMSFGDSVAFHYNYRTKLLEHSFGSLSDFDTPPFLINCKDELIKYGFKKGAFHTDADSVVFVASDALAHYILMMYMLANKGCFEREIDIAESSNTKNANCIHIAKSLKYVDFEKDVVNKLRNIVSHKDNFSRYITSLIKRGLLVYDDYSLAVLVSHPSA